MLCVFLCVCVYLLISCMTMVVFVTTFHHIAVAIWNRRECVREAGQYGRVGKFGQVGVAWSSARDFVLDKGLRESSTRGIDALINRQPLCQRGGWLWTESSPVFTSFYLFILLLLIMGECGAHEYRCPQRPKVSDPLWLGLMCKQPPINIGIGNWTQQEQNMFIITEPYFLSPLIYLLGRAERLETDSILTTWNRDLREEGTFQLWLGNA